MADTLPDLLRPGLALVLVGINPSCYAVQRGHYFARPRNRFWPAFSHSQLSLTVRRGLGTDRLQPEHDVDLPRFGIGLTDLVKVPSAQAAHLPGAAFREEAPLAKRRLSATGARMIAFHGMTAFRPFVRYGLGRSARGLELGPQGLRLGDSELFCLPNPSPANARFSLSDLVEWYDRLADALDRNLVNIHATWRS
ncbi:MAG: mismatch-specific DNA-glycosylase [Candidatus Eremiobacterota bacterium]